MPSITDEDIAAVSNLKDLEFREQIVELVVAGEDIWHDNYTERPDYYTSLEWEAACRAWYYKENIYRMNKDGYMWCRMVYEDGTHYPNGDELP